MKRMSFLGLIAVLVLSFAGIAQAAEIRATGSWQVDASLVNNHDFNSESKDNAFNVAQRMRTAFQFIANENLRGVLETQIGTNSWGNGLYAVGSGRSPSAAAGGALSAGAGNIILRKGFIEFKVPSTLVNVSVGYQSLALPSAFGVGSAILDDHVAGAAAVVPVNSNLSLVGGFARPFDANASGATGINRSGTQADVAFLFANLDYTGFKVQPFLTYAYAGKQATAYSATIAATPTGLMAPQANQFEGVRGYWAGVAFTMTAFEPFKVMADLNYGRATYNQGSQDSGRSGWLADFAVDYTGLTMMTPELFVAYSTGENSDGAKSERMPSLSAENYSYGTFWMQGGDTLRNSYTSPATNLGFLAIGLSLKDIKLIDKLSHTIHVIYFKGTNSKALVRNGNLGALAGGYGNFLTTGDSLLEVDLNSKYQIYDELTLGLELGYINASFDKGIWSAATGYNQSVLSKDAYKATFMLNYSF